MPRQLSLLTPTGWYWQNSTRGDSVAFLPGHLHVTYTKVRSRYCISIPSNQAAKKNFITSKNNNNITGKWVC